MSSTNKFDDEWVADLLDQEAADCALKYSTMGMEAYTKSAKRPSNLPKPNTRFLSSIVKATNNHNRNLLAQERAESQARLNSLDRTKHESEEREKRRRPGAAATRKRMLGGINAIIGGSSKKRKTDDDDSTKDLENDPKRLRQDRGDIHAPGRAHRHHDDDRDGDPPARKDRNARKELFADHGPRRGHPRGHREEERTRLTPESRSRSRSRSRERRHRSHRHNDRHRRTHNGDRHQVSRNVQKDHDPTKTRAKEQLSNDSDSDPLEDLIGPKPPSPVRKRGRGATSGTSAMDGRFESGYDPKTDVALGHEEEDDDWGSSLEALRAREEWKQKGAERLRQAGYTDVEVKKWEKGDQKNEEDVRWTKKGEQREWDRGKTFKDGM
ncbi:hypothetical protein TruAng_011945 [Truncatella angustata]|nr:hypothetical protein TruAng_011945 [Truncatella angustata]